MKNELEEEVIYISSVDNNKCIASCENKYWY